MNKNIIITAIILFLGTSSVGYAALTDKLNNLPTSSPSGEKMDQAKEQITSLANASIDQIKQVLDKAIDQIIVALNKAKATLDELPSESATQQAITLIDETIAYLEGQQVKIASANSVEDLRAIQKETVQYLKDHQDEITTAIVAGCDEAYWQTVEMMQAYLELVKIQSRAMLAISEIDQATHDQVSNKSQEATDKINQSTALYTDGTQTKDPQKISQSLKLLTEAGQLILEIQDLLLPA